MSGALDRADPLALAGRVAIVTGANHGIGAATARLLAAHGASVLLAYLRINESAESGYPDRYRAEVAADATATVDAIRSSGGVAEMIEADLRDPSTPARLFDAAEAAFGPVNILINNATGGGKDTFQAKAIDRFGRSLQLVSATSASRPLEVDARGSALMIAEFAKRHIARGATWGRIVGLTSGGPLGFPEEVSYGAAKAALENYAMSAAFELAPFGITSNVVYPPVTDTGWVTDEVRALVASSPTLFHVAQPEEVAEVILFLVSDAARLVNGTIMHLR